MEIEEEIAKRLPSATISFLEANVVYEKMGRARGENA